MRLDRTFIAIRERGELEILDLAIQVAGQHILPLIQLLFLGALPWMLVDFLLIGWLVYGVSGELNYGHFYWLMFALVVSQAHVGTAMVTYYLGQVMFVEQQSVQQTWQATLKKPWLYWRAHGIWRMVFPLLLTVAIIWLGGESPLMTVSLLLVPAMLVWLLIIRGARPFATEILLLEKTGVKSQSPLRIDFKTRSSSLHGQASAELISRFMMSIPVCAFFFFCFYSICNLLDSVLLLQPTTDFPLKPIYWTVSLWLTVGFAAVFRFLSYIDIRIRQEGWAVELKTRAEGQRLTGEEFP